MKSPRTKPDPRKQIMWRASPAEVKQLLDLVQQRTETQNMIISKAIDRMWCQEMADDAGEALAGLNDGTSWQIKALRNKWGTTTAAIINLAVDRMYVTELIENDYEVARATTIKHNEEANRFVRELDAYAQSLAVDGALEPIAALETAATYYHLEPLATVEGRRAYRTPGGRIINCWLSVADTSTPHIGPGGIGFDNQIGWYMPVRYNDLPVQAEALARADDVRPYSEPDSVCPSDEELAQEDTQASEPIPAD